jgi:hypothetical protein
MDIRKELEDSDFENDDNESFETNSFDIYNPANSISTINSSILFDL